MWIFRLRFQTIISTTSTLSSSQTQQEASTMGAPSNGSKTAHSKVANGTNVGTSGNANQTTSKRSSSGADGDYQLVQHEVLYSQSSQYEVSLTKPHSCVEYPNPLKAEKQFFSRVETSMIVSIWKNQNKTRKRHQAPMSSIREAFKRVRSTTSHTKEKQRLK